MANINISLPSRGECLKLLQEHNVPDHVQKHSIRVAQVAEDIAIKLIEKGVAVEIDLVLAASLLHDIAKMDCLNNGKDHSIEGGNLLSKRGFVELADIVRQHVKLDRICLKTNLPAMITNYSDKRVRHHEIVTLEERFDDIRKRYVKTEQDLERIQQLFEQTKAVEDLLFGIIDEDPDILSRIAAENLQSWAFFKRS